MEFPGVSCDRASVTLTKFLVQSAPRSNKTVEATSKRVSQKMTRRACSVTKRQFAYLHNGQLRTRVTTPYPQNRQPIHRATRLQGPHETDGDKHRQWGNGRTKLPLGQDLFTDDHVRRRVVPGGHTPERHGHHSDYQGLTGGRINLAVDELISAMDASFLRRSNYICNIFLSTSRR